MERFAYTISHDLKSPLITIQAYAGMIVKDLESGRYERASDDIKRIEGAAGKMTDLLNDLLELSRVGRQMNEPAQVEMNRLVNDVLLQLSGPITASRVEIVLQPDLPSVHGDQKRIVEVVQNLIENAIKYMGDQAAPRIEIGTRQDGKNPVFFVSDNGKGIDPCHHEKVFGLFNQLEANSQGTGVGLALVKRIIEVHGGRVWVESEGEGKGSRFCFTVGKA
jgi:light-regulated signal transduction histidine kinase (bacteriophytochrome)